MVESATQKDYSDCEEYKEGYQEYIKFGGRNMKCPTGPHEGDKKTIWLIGWLDARSEDIFGTVAETV